MNPHNQLLHDVYQRAKWNIIKNKNKFVCSAIIDSAESLGFNNYESMMLESTSLKEFHLFFRHLRFNDPGKQLYWPPDDKLSRVKALDFMISLCKKNQL